MKLFRDHHFVKIIIISQSYASPITQRCLSVDTLEQKLNFQFVREVSVGPLSSCSNMLSIEVNWGHQWREVQTEERVQRWTSQRTWSSFRDEPQCWCSTSKFWTNMRFALLKYPTRPFRTFRSYFVLTCSMFFTVRLADCVIEWPVGQTVASTLRRFSWNWTECGCQWDRYHSSRCLRILTHLR